MESPRIDDEHNLIARYAATLAHYDSKSPSEGELSNKMNSSFSGSGSIDSFQLSPEFKMHQNLIDELEASNRHIMEEISQLRQAKDASYSNSNLLFELQMIKQHKGELESRMGKLQNGRRDLMDQLERLMGMLKSRDSNAERVTSPRQRTFSNGSPGKLTLVTSPRLSSTRSYSSRNGTPQLTPQHSISSNSSTYSRTKRQFSELFSAADAINDALSQLVDHVTREEEDEILQSQYDSPFVQSEELSI